MQSISSVCIATVGDEAPSRTRIVEVPFLTNTVPLKKDEELILEVEAKTKKKATKISWRQAMKDDDRSRSRG